MRKYDFEKAIALVEKEKENIKEASIGMYEDWFWTAETIFENGEFKQELNDDTLIGGINKSYWATPTLMIEYKDGTEKMVECFKGEKDANGMGSMLFGPLSKPVQERLPVLTKGEDSK